MTKHRKTSATTRGHDRDDDDDDAGHEPPTARMPAATVAGLLASEDAAAGVPLVPPAEPPAPDAPRAAVPPDRTELAARLDAHRRHLESLDGDDAPPHDALRAHGRALHDATVAQLEQLEPAAEPPTAATAEALTTGQDPTDQEAMSHDHDDDGHAHD
jgi:hypothetical protein